MFKSEFNNFKIAYPDLDTYLIECMGFERTLDYIVRQEARRRFGSVENFLRKIGLGEHIDKIKKSLGE